MNKKNTCTINIEYRYRSGYRTAVLAALLFILSATILLAVRLGSTELSISEILRYLFLEKDTTEHKILTKIRMPRAVAASLVGFSLSLSGCILQGVMRNPLASPNIIGVSAGAGFSAVLIFIGFPHRYYLVTPAAFLGAFLTTILIYSLAWKDGSSPLRLVLSGIAVSAFLSAGSNALMIFFPERIQNVLGFMIGSFSTVSWQQVNGLWPYTLIGFCASTLLADRLNILLLGDETAVSLGVRVELYRCLFIVIASLLAAAAVGVVGLLGFVGLIVPHLARLIIGNNAQYLLPGSALLGGIVVVLCDTLGRVVIRPMELPVGIIMALIGAPFFLYLLRRDAMGKGKSRGH